MLRAEKTCTCLTLTFPNQRCWHLRVKNFPCKTNILKQAARSGPCIEWSSPHRLTKCYIYPSATPQSLLRETVLYQLRVKQGPENSVYWWRNGELERFSEASEFQTQKDWAKICPPPPTTLLWWDSSVFQKEMKPRFKNCELQMLAIFVLKKNFRNNRQCSICKAPIPDSGTKGCFGHWRAS